MEGRGAGMGGMPGAPPIILDAGAQEYYPAVVGGAAAYPPFLPLTPQQLYCPPPYQAMPPPPPPIALPLPLPMPMPIPIPQQIGPTAAAAAAAVDAPASRAVVLSLVPPHAQEGDVARAMAAFGAVRAVDASAVPSERVATVHFFDLRAAELAVAAVRAQHMRQQCRLSQLYAATVSWPPSAAGPGPAPAAWDWPHDDILGLVLGQAVWAQFAAASTLPDDGFSRGSLVVLNSLPDDVSLLELRQAFQAFGDLKDLRQSPHRPSHKFVEFFDTRDAARALAELNGQDFFGHRLVLEFTRPSTPGFRRRGYVPQQQPMAPIPPRLQQAWRPTFPQASSSSSGTGRGREGVVLMRRSSSAKSSGSGDRSKGGNNNNNNGAGRSLERKGKGGKKPTIVVVASSSASSSSTTVATTASSSGKQQCVKSVGRAGSGRSHRGWKGRFDKQFEFKEPEAAAAADTDTQEPETRTTVMIRNIPNKYSQKLVLNMLDAHCIVHNNKQIEAGESECQGQQQPLSSYDFLYLPIDFKNKCNVGYGFVNLTSPEAAVRLHKAFHQQPWEVFNSRKICQVTYARVQGLEALKQHFKNCSFPCESDEYLPVVFSPPRDGQQLTEPVPLVQPSLRAPTSNVDPLALDLMAAAPSSTSGDGASSTMSTHADEGHGASCSNDDDDDNDDEGLAEELQRLGYTD